jgi:hypothetical protein
MTKYQYIETTLANKLKDLPKVDRLNTMYKKQLATEIHILHEILQDLKELHKSKPTP